MATELPATLTLRREDGRIVCESVVVATRSVRRMRGPARPQVACRPGEGVVLRPALVDPHRVHALSDRRRLRRPRAGRDQDRSRRCARSRPRPAAARARSSSSPPASASGAGSRSATGSRGRRGASSRTALSSRERAAAGRAHEAVIVASGDQRFVKLARFLLDGRGYRHRAQVRPDEVGAALEDGDVDAVLLDAGDGLGDALRLSNAVRARPAGAADRDRRRRRPWRAPWERAPSTTSGSRWTRRSTRSESRASRTVGP